MNAAEEHSETKGAVAVIAPPRLAYAPGVEERFGVDRAAWKALVEAVFPAAQTSDAVVLALSYCKARKMDPFKRVVHIVPIWDSGQKKLVETVWPGIAEQRTTAFRTKQYGGSDAATFGETVEHTFTDRDQSITVRFPEWSQITVYRMIDGQRIPIPGPRVYWTETYSRRGRTSLPNDRWTRAPFQMIEKCAEAAALRRAFPEELGDEQTADEAGSYVHESAEPKDVTPAPPRPTRAEFEQKQREEARGGKPAPETIEGQASVVGAGNEPDLAVWEQFADEFLQDLATCRSGDDIDSLVNDRREHFDALADDWPEKLAELRERVGEKRAALAPTGDGQRPAEGGETQAQEPTPPASEVMAEFAQTVQGVERAISGALSLRGFNDAISGHAAALGRMKSAWPAKQAELIANIEAKRKSFAGRK